MSGTKSSSINPSSYAQQRGSRAQQGPAARGGDHVQQDAASDGPRQQGHFPDVPPHLRAPVVPTGLIWSNGIVPEEFREGSQVQPIVIPFWLAHVAAHGPPEQPGDGPLNLSPIATHPVLAVDNSFPLDMLPIDLPPIDPNRTHAAIPEMIRHTYGMNEGLSGPRPPLSVAEPRLARATWMDATWESADTSYWLRLGPNMSALR